MNKIILSGIVLLSSLYSSAQQWGLSNAPRPRDINAVAIFNTNNLVVGGGNRTNDSIRSVFTSQTGGLEWDINLDVLSGWVKSFHFKDSLNGIAVGFGGKILQTVDGGKIWSPLPSPINRDFNKIFFLDPQTGYIAGGKQDTLQTILKTTNGGQSWSVVLDQNGFWLNSVSFSSATTGYAVGDSATILKTTNGGDTWAPITAPIQRHFNDIVFADANNGVIAGGNFATDSLRTILTTTNGGNTWNITKDELGGWLTDVTFLDQYTGYAVGAYATLLKTTDGGQNWTPETVNPAVFTDHFTSVAYLNADFGVIGGQDGKIFVYSSAPVSEVYTLGSENVTASQATMIAGIRTFSSHAHYTFRFSASSDLSGAFETLPRVIQSDSIARVVASVSNLTPNTTYYYVAKAKTLGGTVYGDTLSFYTGTPTQEFKTLNAVSLTATSAKFYGTMKGLQEPVTLYFQYGLTPALGSQVAATPATVSDDQQHAIEATVNTLTAGTIYYFRMRGVTATGNLYGDTRIFYSGQVYTSLETLLPNVMNDSTVELYGAVEGLQFPAIMGFDYGPDTAGFIYRGYITDSIVTDALRHDYKSWISGLDPGIIYYYRIRATTPIGVFYGDTLAFFTGSSGVNVLTHTATDVTSSSAQLNGSIEKMKFPVSLSFQYSTDLSFGTEVIAAPASISDSLRHDASAFVTGLQDNTLYYYRIKAETAEGIKLFGNTKQLYTGEPTIPNWDFQHWAMDSVLLPVGWNVAGRGERVPGHSGDYALKIIGQTICLLGYFKEVDDGPFFFGGVPVSGRPDSVIMYMDYQIAPGDTGLMILSLTKNGVQVGGSPSGFVPITGNSGGAFQRVALPIEYLSGDTPDSVAIGFAPTNPDAPGISANYITVDDIRLSPSTNVISHGDFENWFSYQHKKLLEWHYNAYVGVDSANTMLPMVSQVLYSLPDDFAAEIRNRSWGGGYIEGSVSSAVNGNDRYPSFPIPAKHQSLNGYYQFFPENNDTLQIELMLFMGDSVLGSITFLQADSVTEFTALDIPLHYNSTGVMPDSASLRINCTTHNANGNSRVIIDKLKFDGLAPLGEITAIQSRTIPVLKIYPNPTASFVKIQLEKESAGVLEIYSLNGRTVHTQHFTGSSIDVSTAAFPEGFYIVSILKDNKRFTSKLMVIR